MLLFIKVNKEFEMLKSILIIMTLLVTFSVASMEQEMESLSLTTQEQLILKLKLRIYELKEKNSKLEKIIHDFNSKMSEDNRRAEAIAQLKKDLRASRETRSQSLLILR